MSPEGEKLIEYVEKEWKKQPHVGELPLDIVAQVVEHGDKAEALANPDVQAAIEQVTGFPKNTSKWKIKKQLS